VSSICRLRGTQGQGFEPIFSPAADPDAGFEQAVSAAPGPAHARAFEAASDQVSTFLSIAPVSPDSHIPTAPITGRLIPQLSKSFILPMICAAQRAAPVPFNKKGVDRQHRLH